MANLGRGAYEPPDDVHIFNGAEEDDDAEGSRLPLLIVIALFVLAAFGGVVWLAYTQGVARGRSDTPRTIAAEPGPAKVAAAQDAGPNTGLKVYQQPAPADDQSDRQVAPPPSNAAPETDVVTPHVQEQVQEAPPPKTPPVPVKPTVVAKAPPPPEIRTTTSAPSPEAEATAPPAQLGVKAKAPPPAKPAKVDAAPAPKVETASAPTAGGAYLLQIGAYKSEAEADSAWASYRAKHGATLSGYAKDVKQVDLGAKGTWYRLRVGSFASKAAAQELCGKLTAEGGACFLAK
jgi:cell division protein FtsN